MCPDPIFNMSYLTAQFYVYYCSLLYLMRFGFFFAITTCRKLFSVPFFAGSIISFLITVMYKKARNNKKDVPYIFKNNRFVAGCK